MDNRAVMIGIVALLAAIVTMSFGKDDSDDELRNPQVMRTYPANGQVLRAGVVTIKVTFDLPMRADGYSLVRTDKGAFPSCPGKPRLAKDGRTFELDCVLEPGKRYAMMFNHGRFMNFVSADGGVPAISYGISFSTR